MADYPVLFNEINFIGTFQLVVSAFFDLLQKKKEFHCFLLMLISQSKHCNSLEVEPV